MDYELSAEQNILKESAHKLLGKEYTSETVRKMAEDGKGYSENLWKKMAELGWMSLLIPEEYDGSGVNFLDLAVLLSEFGYYCASGPFFSTVVLGGLPVLALGSETQKSALLPGIADGKRKLTLAWLEADGEYGPEAIHLKAEAGGNEFQLTGTKLFVPDAHLADTIVCAARTSESAEGISLFLVDAGQDGLQLTPLDTMSGEKQYKIVFDRVTVPAENLLGELNGAWPTLSEVLLKAAVAKCAEMTGAAEKVMELVVPYTKGRKQFGKPVGSFQAVQHHCANMLTFQDTGKLMTWQAAWRISEGLSYAAEAAMCKSWVSESHVKLVGLGHQIIGGLAFMEEFDLQLYFKQARMAAQLYGSSDDHREIVAREMGL